MAPRQGFEDAAFTVSERYVQQRLIPMALDAARCRRAAAVRGDITSLGDAIPHILKIMTAITSASPSTRCVSWRPPSAVVRLQAQRLRRRTAVRGAVAQHGVAVRWNESRSENTQATIQGRGQIQNIELAADADGKLTALRVRLLCDMGAYLQLVTPGIPILGAFLYAGVYDLPQAYDLECTSVFPR